MSYFNCEICVELDIKKEFVQNLRHFGSFLLCPFSCSKLQSFLRRKVPNCWSYYKFISYFKTHEKLIELIKWIHEFKEEQNIFYLKGQERLFFNKMSSDILLGFYRSKKDQEAATAILDLKQRENILSEFSRSVQILDFRYFYHLNHVMRRTLRGNPNNLVEIF